MPKGKKVKKRVRKHIIELLMEGLSPPVISERTGVTIRTIRKIKVEQGGKGCQ